jgi:DNA-directed RNA polymerase specialized sigma24 family protein
VLPESYRAVLMLLEVEGLSMNETAEGLGVGEEAVKTRLHRARAMIQVLTDQLGTRRRRSRSTPSAATELSRLCWQKS